MNKPLRICLMMQGGYDHNGGSEYITNIILALGSLPYETRQTFELCLLGDLSSDLNLHNRLTPHLDKIYDSKVCLETSTLKNRICWKITSTLFQQQYPIYDNFFKKENIDFVYPYFSLTKHKSYGSAALIYDLQHKYLPKFFTENEIKERDKLFTWIANHASTIVLSSKAAESDFCQFFPEAAQKTKILSFKACPSLNWYEGEPQHTQQEYCLPDRFFLLSNQFWQHKNHLLVFDALKILQKQSIYPIVVCTGNLYDYRKPEYANKILQTIHKLGLAKQIFLLGLIPKYSQIQLMRRSLAVIQPSLFEGWSTLVENARCFRKQLIISDLSVHIEQDPPNSVFFDRNSPENLADILADKWNSLSPGPNLKEEEIARKYNLSDVQSFGYRFLEIANNC
jgi:glycosyltransferase involved in cell wall biosynthesis